MSKVELITTGDWHLCIDVQCPAGRHPETFYDEQRAKLKFIRDYCVEHSIPTLVPPGDLFNYKNPSMYTTASINSLVNEFKLLQDVTEVCAISGNHDLKMSSREMKPNSVYNIFAASGLITDLHSKVKHLADDVTLSGLDYNHNKENLMKEVALLNGHLDPNSTNIVVLHEHLLPTGDTLPFGQHINYDDFLEFTNIDIIISGHLHKGYPTQTLEAVDLESDDEGHKITFVNPWSLTRVARDHYALSDEHVPELVHLTIEDGEVSFKHVPIDHNHFDIAFVKKTLVSEEAANLDIGEFVSSLSEFEGEVEKALDMKDKSESVKESIEHYTTLAESQLAS